MEPPIERGHLTDVELDRYANQTDSTVGRIARLYRVRDWIHFLALPFATIDTQVALVSSLLPVGRGVASAFAILSFGYLLNCIADRNMDRDSRKNPLIAPDFAEPRYLLAIPLVVSLLLAAFSPWPAQVSTVVSLTCLVVYSAGPRVKSIPIVGSLVNVGNFAPLLFVGMGNTPLPVDFAFLVWAFSGLLLQNQLIHEAADQVEDRAGDVHTTWLTLGPRWTAALAALSALIAIAAAVRFVPEGGAVPVAGIGVVVFGVIFPVLLATYGPEPERAPQLRILHRWCALLFGAALYLVWR